MFFWKALPGWRLINKHRVPAIVDFVPRKMEPVNEYPMMKVAMMEMVFRSANLRCSCCMRSLRVHVSRMPSKAKRIEGFSRLRFTSSNCKMWFVANWQMRCVHIESVKAKMFSLLRSSEMKSVLAAVEWSSKTFKKVAWPALAALMATSTFSCSSASTVPSSQTWEQRNMRFEACVLIANIASFIASSQKSLCLPSKSSSITL
mmetsp:Transcript_18252/g.39934  ORF Transcript_18252/g.39934 Transcript_18252/m.39934 type:complete len:203 (+) Transcript_18252:251-859(+)